MDILPNLAKKYPFFNAEISNIFIGNIFYHIDQSNPKATLFIYDGNIAEIIEPYKVTSAISLNIEQPRAKPTLENAQKILYFIKNHQIQKIFGFGGGAINDLCKYAASTTNIEYVFIPTALSMNGMVSSTSSLYSEEEKIKKSLQTTAPSSIILEKEILLFAPKKFINSAIMDSFAAYTACNDFIFASLTEPKKYHFEQKVFDIFDKIMVEIYNIITTNSSALYNNFNTIVKVFEMLYVSGSIMNYYGSSIQFSGGEHHIAHTLEAMFPQLSQKFLHGEIISAILPYYSAVQYNYNKRKYVKKKIIRHNNRFNFEEIANTLGIYSNPEQLGITYEDFTSAVQKAKFAKERPTLLNLLY